MTGPNHMQKKDEATAVQPYDALAALVLNIDAGGATLGAMRDAREVLESFRLLKEEGGCGMSELRKLRERCAKIAVDIGEISGRNQDGEFYVGEEAACFAGSVVSEIVAAIRAARLTELDNDWGDE